MARFNRKRFVVEEEDEYEKYQQFLKQQGSQPDSKPTHESKWDNQDDTFSPENIAKRKKRAETLSVSEMINDGKEFFNTLIGVQTLVEDPEFDKESDFGWFATRFISKMQTQSDENITKIDELIKLDEKQKENVVRINEGFQNLAQPVDVKEEILNCDISNVDKVDLLNNFETNVEINKIKGLGSFSMDDTVEEMKPWKIDDIIQRTKQVKQDDFQINQMNHELAQHPKLGYVDDYHLQADRIKCWFKERRKLLNMCADKLKILNDTISKILTNHDRDEKVEEQLNKCIMYRHYFLNKIKAVEILTQLQVKFWLNEDINEKYFIEKISTHRQNIAYIPAGGGKSTLFNSVNDTYFDIDELLKMIDWRILKWFKSFDQNFYYSNILWQCLLIIYDFKFIGKILLMHQPDQNVFDHRNEIIILPNVKSDRLDFDNYFKLVNYKSIRKMFLGYHQYDFYLKRVFNMLFINNYLK